MERAMRMFFTGFAFFFGALLALVVAVFGVLFGLASAMTYL